MSAVTHACPPEAYQQGSWHHVIPFLLSPAFPPDRVTSPAVSPLEAYRTSHIYKLERVVR